MTGDSLPFGDHVSRYCKPKALSEDGQPLGAAFILRKNEEYLSVSWLEYFRMLGIEAQLAEVRDHIHLNATAKAKYAILNVGNTINHVNENSDIKIEIMHEPSKGDPSHSGIRGYKYEDEMIGDLIAETVISIHPAKTP